MHLKYLLLLIVWISSVNLAFAQDKPEDKLKDLGIELPPPTKPVANFVKYVKTGNLVFLAGHGPCDPEVPRGKLGKDLSIEQGYQAARQTATCLLSTLKDAIGDLNKVKRVVRVFGMVNCTADFTDQPKVINGCSDLLTEVFGEQGKHARAAVGMNSLPSIIPVEIEMIVEIEE